MWQWIVGFAQNHPFIALFVGCFIALMLFGIACDILRPHWDRKRGENVWRKTSAALIALVALGILSGCAKEMTAEERALAASMEDRIIAAQPDTMILTKNNELARIIQVESYAKDGSLSSIRILVKWEGDGLHARYSPRVLARMTRRIADSNNRAETTAILLEWWLQDSVQPPSTPQPPARSGSVP